MIQVIFEEITEDEFLYVDYPSPVERVSEIGTDSFASFWLLHSGMKIRVLITLTKMETAYAEAHSVWDENGFTGFYEWKDSESKKAVSSCKFRITSPTVPELFNGIDTDKYLDEWFSTLLSCSPNTETNLNMSADDMIRLYRNVLNMLREHLSKE